MSFAQTTFADTLARASIAGPSVVAIGTFDGVHRGHQHLLRVLAEQGRQYHATPVVLTFHPRPIEVLRPGVVSQYLCTVEKRLALLRAAGAAVALPVEFSPALAQVSARDFCAGLVQHLGMRALVGGPDLALGHGREGTPPVLREIGAQLGFAVIVVPAQTADGTPIRSSAIHRLLGEGDVAGTGALLGRPYALPGTVVRGEGRGRRIGVPTANVAVPDRLVWPADGVYAVYFEVGGRRWPGAANVGVRPTFDGERRSLEVHLLDFDGELYGQSVTVEFVARLRPEQRFPGIDALVAQIREDIRQTRAFLQPSRPVSPAAESPASSP
jgi:riboflavin kinase/FMN adenylyltransferase